MLRLEAAALHRLDEAMAASGLWDELATDWVLWDAEIMPWSMKAVALVLEQYAPVGAAAIAGLGALVGRPRDGTCTRRSRRRSRGVDGNRLDDARAIATPITAMSPRSPVIDDLRIAPFHLLASEGAVHAEQGPSVAHGSGPSARRCGPGAVCRNGYRHIDLDDPEQVADAVRWWEELTAEVAKAWS